jgi:hypothetical protein
VDNKPVAHEEFYPAAAEDKQENPVIGQNNSIAHQKFS